MVSREKLVTALNGIRKAKVCDYLGETCDCKYGGPAYSAGSEQTGCPEMREAAAILQAMTESEFRRINDRIVRRAGREYKEFVAKRDG